MYKGTFLHKRETFAREKIQPKVIGNSDSRKIVNDKEKNILIKLKYRLRIRNNIDDVN